MFGTIPGSKHASGSRNEMEQEDRMSIFFLWVVIAALQLDPSLIEAELLHMWALFSIADALWFKILFGGKK